jgi:para-aminobenzoate synthetase component 1
MEINNKKFTQDELLSRLDERESHVTVFSHTTDAGWSPVVAWSPVDILTIKDSDKNPKKRINDFVLEQQKNKRLVAGYLSYDFGATLHHLSLSTDDDLRTPLSMMLSFDNWITFETGTAMIHANDALFNDEVVSIMARTPREIPSLLYSTALSPAWSRDAYNQAYDRIHYYIKAGDIYQANLTHRLEGTSDTYGLDIYRSISSKSHADFQSYMAGTDFEIISASPERFVKIENNTIDTMPIKGTRPRGNTPERDEAIRADLLTSTKDMAELDMITDLLRNDMGAVSEIGSVKVINRRLLTAYPTLWHAHSEIRSRIRSDISPIEALMSLMPGGSITGCPKKRAMEIIDELEQKRRGIYTGSIFTLYPDGTLDSNIAIRTMIKKKSNIYLSVGGGIVYDSQQSDEYDESLQKAAAFLEH